MLMVFSLKIVLLHFYLDIFSNSLNWYKVGLIDFIVHLVVQLLIRERCDFLKISKLFVVVAYFWKISNT